MAKVIERLRAEELRRKGLSINQIAGMLEVSKSIVSIWCRDILLTDKQREKLTQNSIKGGHKGRMLGSLVNKQKRLDLIDRYRAEGKKEISKLSRRDLLIAGTCLYWAEGSKTGGRFIFVNSDSDMILLIYRFITEILKVPQEDIRVTIQINRIHEKRINEVKRFWSKLLKLPLAQFNKPYYVNVVPKKIYSNYNEYYGLVRLKILKSSHLQYKVLGLINALK